MPIRVSIILVDNFKELGMAIDEIHKNRGVNVSPFKNTSKSGTPSEKLDFSTALSGIKPAVERRSIERADSVVITDAVTKIRQSFESSSTKFDIDAERAEKLARIKAAIENKTYKINPERIASKMMQDAILWG